MKIEFLHHLKTILIKESLHLSDFMRLLMKPRNGEQWAPEEKAALLRSLRLLSSRIPALVIFALPGGSLLLPLLAWYLDRRHRKKRQSRSSDSPQASSSHPGEAASPTDPTETSIKPGLEPESWSG